MADRDSEDPGTEGDADSARGPGAEAEDPDGARGAAAVSARAARAAAAVRRANRRPGLVRAVRATRELLPGDQNYGDELSIAGDKPSQVIGRYLAESGESGESASREAGLAALQVWQAVSQRVGRGSGMVKAAILFTDIVGFSSWVLEAGDESGLELLRAVGAVVEPTVSGAGGKVVKRLGDGHMAVFGDPTDGVEAALRIQDGLQEVEIGGYRPKLRAGLHYGQPRSMGGDYLGADVNIAARVGAAAGPGEVLVSDAVLGAVDSRALEVKRVRGFRAKGTPRELQVFRVSRRA